MGQTENPVRYSIITDKNPREIVMLRGSGCRYLRCRFCDYHLDSSRNEEENYRINKEALSKVNGIYHSLEVINSGSFLELDEKTNTFGHGGSDFYCMDEFIKKINGDSQADIIDVYEALDMFLPGMFAYRSILRGGISVEIPNLRKPEEREKYRNDTACTDPKVAGGMLLPTFSKGTPQIDKKVYEAVNRKFEASKY